MQITIKYAHRHLKCMPQPCIDRRAVEASESETSIIQWCRIGHQLLAKSRASTRVREDDFGLLTLWSQSEAGWWLKPPACDAIVEAGVDRIVRLLPLRRLAIQVAQRVADTSLANRSLASWAKGHSCSLFGLDSDLLKTPS